MVRNSLNNVTVVIILSFVLCLRSEVSITVFANLRNDTEGRIPFLTASFKSDNVTSTPRFQYPNSMACSSNICSYNIAFNSFD